MKKLFVICMMTLLSSSAFAAQKNVIKIIPEGDKVAQRNVENVLAFYELMINQKMPLEATQQYLVKDYIQHNPLIGTGAVALGSFFDQVVKTRPHFRVVVHRIIGVGNHVWAHVNFINLYSDDKNDLGIAGVDVYQLNDEGKVVEHWDTLQPVPDPKTAQNRNGMF